MSELSEIGIKIVKLLYLIIFACSNEKNLYNRQPQYGSN